MDPPIGDRTSGRESLASPKLYDDRVFWKVSTTIVPKVILPLVSFSKALVLFPKLPLSDNKYEQFIIVSIIVAVSRSWEQESNPEN